MDDDLREIYERDGFVSLLSILDGAEAEAERGRLREFIQAMEASLKGLG